MSDPAAKLDVSVKVSFCENLGTLESRSDTHGELKGQADVYLIKLVNERSVARFIVVNATLRGLYKVHLYPAIRAPCRGEGVFHVPAAGVVVHAIPVADGHDPTTFEVGVDIATLGRHPICTDVTEWQLMRFQVKAPNASEPKQP